MTKMCFVASPIGAPGSPVRIDADAVLNELIRPALVPLGYQVVRADEDRTPGLITEKVMKWVMEADLMLADLSGANSNVMYELAVRHSARKPVIQMALVGSPLPFDIAGLDTIFYDHDIATRTRTIQAITSAVGSAVAGRVGSNPVSLAVDAVVLAESPFTGSQVIAERLDDLRRAVAEMRSDMMGKPNAARRPAPGEHAMSILSDETIAGKRLRTEGWTSITLTVADDDLVELGGVYRGVVYASVISEPDWWIQSDKAIREIATRMVDNLIQQGIVASMRNDLKNLVINQEAYFADNNSYASKLGQKQKPGIAVFIPTPGNNLVLSNVSPQGYTAVITNASLTTGVNTCGVYVGPATNAPNPSIVYEGAPACWSQ